MSKTQKTPKIDVDKANDAGTIVETNDAQRTETFVEFSERMIEQVERAILEPGRIEHVPEYMTQAKCDVLNAHEVLNHDDDLKTELRDGEFALAAVCYAMTPAWRSSKDHLGNPLMRTLWPLPLYQFEATPEDRRSELVRAAALLIAEVERMDAAAPESVDA